MLLCCAVRCGGARGRDDDAPLQQELLQVDGTGGALPVRETPLSPKAPGQRISGDLEKKKKVKCSELVSIIVRYGYKLLKVITLIDA